MLIRLLLCFIIAATVEGSPRQNYNLNLQIKSAEKAKTWLPFYSWQQFRIDPWILRRPGVWGLSPHISHINLATIRRRRRVSTHSRKSKWSKLFAKHNKNHFNEITKLNPFLSRSRSSDPHWSVKAFPRTWKSVSHYAKPSWLLRLRKKLNIEDNGIDDLPRTFTSTKVGNKHFAKIARLQWKPKQDVSYADYLSRNGLGRLDGAQSSMNKNYKIPIPEPNRLFDGDFQPETETSKGISPLIGENSSVEDESWSGENSERPPRRDESSYSMKSDIPALFGPYEPVDQSGFQHSKDSFDGFLSSGDIVGGDDQNLFDFPEPISDLKTTRYSGNDKDKSDGIFEARGSSSGTIGNPLSDHLTQPLEQSMGESFGQVDERSSSDSSIDGFGTFDDSFLPITEEGDGIYGDLMSYTDLDDTGFGSLDGFGQFGQGSFVEETDNCDGIETRSCFSDSECICFGIYFCREGTCASISTSSDDKDLPLEMSGIWHEAPMTE